nr:MAG TPA: Protocadherin-15, LHFPL tetraspan subfamily member, LHFPL5, protocadherin, tip link [Caudoviricetes sp.]
MSLIVVALLAFILGLLCCPLVIFLRARKCDQWDKSNMFNIYRVVAHLATHPDDFGKMYYDNGEKPFWYIDDDEFTDVVRTRRKF